MDTFLIYLRFMIDIIIIAALCIAPYLYIVIAGMFLIMSESP